jgi:hypothetical protein
LEVWQNSAIFGSRQISGAVEALLTKVINWRSSVSLILFLLPLAGRAAVGVMVDR